MPPLPGGVRPGQTVLDCARPAGSRLAPARKACSVATTCAPSPTAAATRFTEPARTSPMANTPWRLVSSGRRSPARSRTRPHEALGVQRHAGSGQPVGVRRRADEEEQVADRPPHLLARRAAPADRLQHAVAAFEAGDLGLRHHLDVGEALDAVDEVARHARPRGPARAPAARPWRPGSPDRRPPGRPNCRRPPARPPARRRASPRAARPSSARSSPRNARGSSTSSRR